jgi:Amt family ammonium transporter
VFSLVTVLWASTATRCLRWAGTFFGGFDKLFLKGITIDSVAATFSKGVYIPELLFVAFQCTFAGITCALIIGAFAERVKFAAVLLFVGAVVHVQLHADGPHGLVLGRPGCDHRRQDVLEAVTANAGWLWAKGALDFAGGTVVHINAGVAGLVGAFLIGKRIGYGRESMAPHSLTLTMVGASLLWVGWFGFNAGSNLEAAGTAAMAFVNTFVATAAATCWPGPSPSGWARASRRCWVQRRVRSPGWWPSLRPAASSVRWARSSSVWCPAWSACGA